MSNKWSPPWVHHCPLVLSVCSEDIFSVCKWPWVPPAHRLSEYVLFYLLGFCQLPPRKRKRTKNHRKCREKIPSFILIVKCENSWDCWILWSKLEQFPIYLKVCMVHISQLDEQHGSWPLGPPAAAATTVRTFCQASLNLGLYNSAGKLFWTVLCGSEFRIIRSLGTTFQ